MNDFLELLKRLTEARLQFVVVGGTAAVLHGSSMATYDLDLVMPFTRQNCERLLASLASLHPRLSHSPDKRPLSYSAEELTRFKNLYLVTDLGRLDLLGSLEPVADASSLLAVSPEMDVGGVSVKVVPIEMLIEVKAALGRPKDKHVELELRAIQAARRLPKGSG